jgi:hypothetical protein
MTKDLNNENLPENLQKALLEIDRRTDTEDSYIRKQQIRIWKKYERFWHGVQYIWWSETQQDWLSPIDTRWDNSDEANREGAEGPFYDYVINIYKAHGESVIAALAAQIPAVRFPPDDADNEDDLVTSKVYGKIADLIQRHNQSKMLMLGALLCLWNQGLVCAYHAPKSDKAFGNIKIPNYGLGCEACGYQAQSNDEENCPTCPPLADPNDPMAAPMSAPLTPIVTGFTESPKSRVLIDLFGPLFARVPYFSRNQKDFGYIKLVLDQPIAHLKFLYPHVAEKIENSIASSDTYERVARSPSTFAYAINDQTYLGELRRLWFRPWEFELLGKEFEAEIKELNKLFPNGCYVCFIGDTFVEARNECMDKYWTIGKAGLSTYIHADPLGQPLIPLQEMKNVTKNLELETIEQGISSIYADPEVMDFEDYSRHEQRPGTTYPVKAKPGQKIADSFYEGPKASLSKDVGNFEESVLQDAQFVVGDFPSVYGGPTEASSRTAAEYSMSHANALQRLSISWTFLTHWWAELMGKCVTLFVENVVSDQRYVMREKNNYVNVWIRQSELRGKVGDVEPEGAETFPITTAQKQSLLMQLIGLNNEMLNAALFDPENRKIIADALAFPELHIPDEDQRIKQMREIQVMLGSGNRPGIPVAIEPDVDDDHTHIVSLKDYMVSEAGLDCKVTNPEGYQYMLEHLQMHLQHEALTQMPLGPSGQQGGPAPQPGQQNQPKKIQSPNNQPTANKGVMPNV